MTDLNEYNAKIIEEFRANGGMFPNGSLLLLHHTGAPVVILDPVP